MKKYILMLAGLLVLQYASAQTTIDRSKQPKAGPAPAITITDPVVFKTANGITVLVVEDHRIPKISASLTIDAGPITEGTKAGVVSLMGNMLNEGTKTMPKAAFDEAVDKLGADVSLQSSGGSASALTRYFDEAFGLMALALKEPAFTQESFDKLKSQALTELKNESKNAKAIAGRVTNALTYGKDHPDGEFETEESIQSLTVQDVKTAYSKYITPSRSYLTIIGDIKPADAKALVNKALGNWAGAALTLPVIANVPNPGKTEIDVVDVPNAVQSEIRVVNLLNLKRNDPDYFPALLANYILGGGAESRLFMNLREKHGFTYGAYSSLGAGRFQTTFAASAAVRNAKVDSAVAEFINEIRRIRTEKVSAEELSNAKALYNGSFALGLEDPARTATFASNILINDLPADFYRTYLQKVNAVTADDILRVAQKYILADNDRVIVVGGVAKTLDGLKKLGYPVKMYDALANPITDAAKPTASASAVLNDFIKAIGGADALKKVSSMDISMNMAMQGMAFSLNVKKMLPNKELTVATMGSNVVMKTVFDGDKGYQLQGGAKHDLAADDIAQKKATVWLTRQLDYVTNPAFKAEVKSIQKVNGADAYQLIVTDPTGKAVTEYYDVNTKLLVKQESSSQINGNTVLKTIELSDYRKIGDILFPYKETLTNTIGEQQQTFLITVADVKLNTGVTADDFK